MTSPVAVGASVVSLRREIPCVEHATALDGDGDLRLSTVNGNLAPRSWRHAFINRRGAAVVDRDRLCGGFGADLWAEDKVADNKQTDGHDDPLHHCLENRSASHRFKLIMTDGYAWPAASMPTEVYEEPLNLVIDELEAIPFPEDKIQRRGAYPYPYLRKTGRRSAVELISVVLENELLKVSVLPQLGGRIFQMLHKPSGKIVMGGSEELYVSDAPAGRGAELHDGIRWAAWPYDDEGLAPVEHMLIEPEDEDSPAGIRMSAMFFSVSRDLVISLSPQESRVRIEFLSYEREWTRGLSAPNMLVGGGYSRIALEGGEALMDPEGKTGIAVSFDRNSVRYSREEPDSKIVRIARSEGIGYSQAGHSLDRWQVTLAPLVGLDSVSAMSEDLALQLRKPELRVFPFVSCSSAKVFLLLANGQSVEAQASLGAGELAVFPLEGIASNVEAVSIRGEGREIIEWARKDKWRQSKRRRRDLVWTSGHSIADEAFEKMLAGKDALDELGFATKDFETKFKAFLGLGLYALRNGEYLKAAEHLEQALIYNGEDHLAWWMRAAALRLAGEESEESPELLNAHYLAPLEPVLRAESFFRQPPQPEGPSALLKPLADNPEAFVEVAWLLHDCKMFADLSKWVHEALKFREIPMLRYILADALLQTSDMKMEAAHHVQVASKTPINPPYPTREIEYRLLAKLRGLFPADERIRELMRMMEECIIPPHRHAS